MGAVNFEADGRGESAEDVFRMLVEEAQYEHGHGGYTGTIAEKDGYGFELFEAFPGLDGFHVAWAAYEEDESQVPADRLADFRRLCRVANEKWGPAACVDQGDGSYIFFGIASS